MRRAAGAAREPLSYWFNDASAYFTGICMSALLNTLLLRSCTRLCARTHTHKHTSIMKSTEITRRLDALARSAELRKLSFRRKTTTLIIISSWRGGQQRLNTPAGGTHLHLSRQKCWRHDQRTDGGVREEGGGMDFRKHTATPGFFLLGFGWLMLMIRLAAEACVFLGGQEEKTLNKRRERS